MSAVRDRSPITIGSYWVNVRTGQMVEIMDIAHSGTCRVLDILADVDAEWTQLTEPEISSALWRRIEPAI